MINPNVRRIDETFEAFKARRTLTNAGVKKYLKGRVLWDSSNLGTYRNNPKGYRYRVIE